eukprot:SAG31_NODE_3179_length_4583_cov_1.884478_2_plen_106_part_00
MSSVDNSSEQKSVSWWCASSQVLVDPAAVAQIDHCILRRVLVLFEWVVSQLQNLHLHQCSTILADVSLFCRSAAADQRETVGWRLPIVWCLLPVLVTALQLCQPR